MDLSDTKCFQGIESSTMNLCEFSMMALAPEPWRSLPCVHPSAADVVDKIVGMERRML